MMEFLSKLLDTSDFPPRWQTGNWTPEHGWLHVTADLMMWAAFTAIPIVILYFVIRKRDVPFPRVLVLFGMFILACGATHLIEACTFWWPVYRLSAVVKLTTAAVSWATVLVLIPTMPKALALPGLAKINADLAKQIAERSEAQAALSESEKSLRLANARLQQKNKEIEEFVYTVSHDLKSPVATMLGFVEYAMEDVAAGRLEDLSDSFPRIKRAALRMSNLIDDLLKLSRVGRLPLEPATVDIGKTVRELSEGMSDRLARAGAELVIEQGLPSVEADPTRFSQAIDNLLENAIKYACRQGGARIVVGAKSIGEEIWVCVRDNGPGIAPEYHERIFGLFQRLADDDEGTGIGLAIVSKIMQAHGGRAWVESSPGQGATFWLAFPHLGGAASR